MSEHETEPQTEPHETEQQGEPQVGSVPDEALPEELVPGPENPLAEGLPPGETVEGLLDSREEAEARSRREQTGEDDAGPSPETGTQTGSAPQEQ